MEARLCAFGCFRMARESSQNEYETIGQTTMRIIIKRRAKVTPINFIAVGKSLAKMLAPFLSIIPVV
jgi:hypothetical protein